MQDTRTTVQELKEKMAQFVTERDWNKFHSPKNLSMYISIEAAELMEKFLWVDSAQSHEHAVQKREEIEQELADVIIIACMFANATSIDISGAIERKMALNAQKYP